MGFRPGSAPRRLGPAPTLSGGYPEPASLAPAPPPGYPAQTLGAGASRRGAWDDNQFDTSEATASWTRLARGPGVSGRPREL